jgi:hypothetical protein
VVAATLTSAVGKLGNKYSQLSLQKRNKPLPNFWDY